MQKVALLTPPLLLSYDAGPNPWGAAGLEWTTSSPPPTENFLETPVVNYEAYHYSDEEPVKVGMGPHDSDPMRKEGRARPQDAERADRPEGATGPEID